MTPRALNFSPGPGALPLAALEQARSELLDFEGSGMSILEHSHRGRAYEAVHEEAIALLTELLSVPNTHQVLLLQGGARQQFALVPMNLLRPGDHADYVVTGLWGEGAVEEAKIVGDARVAATTQHNGTYCRVLRAGELTVSPGSTYVHYTTNETVHGVQFHVIPDVGTTPLVADVSSDFLSRPFDVSRHALIYAGAQKNAGPSGVTIVIVRKDLLDRAPATLPKIFRYSTQAATNSLYNTAPTFAIYLMRNVLQWLQARGGLTVMGQENQQKAATIYEIIDRYADVFQAPVEKESRSQMNVVFRLPSPEVEKRFLEEAAKRHMVGLKGHRSVGGIRASLYNAVSVDAVMALAELLTTFAATG